MHPESVWMALLDEGAAHAIVAVLQIDDLTEFEVAKDAVMGFAGFFLAEEAEKHEDIAYPHTLIGKMGLRGAALPEQTAAVIEKHRVVMAKVFARYPAPTGSLRSLAQAQIAIARARPSAAGDR